MRLRSRTLGSALVTATVCAAATAAADTLVELDGGLNVNYTRTTGVEDAASRVSAELRPGIVYQIMGDRLVARFGYLFAAALAFDEAGASTYSNHIDVSTLAQLSPRSRISFTLAATQGGTAFQISQRAADTGTPEIRNTANENTVNGFFTETFSFDASPDLQFTQGLSAAVNAPQADLDLFNLSLNGAIGLERVWPQDSAGLELLPSVAALRPLQQGNTDLYANLTNSLVAHWTHDFSRRWSGSARLGVQQIVTLTGSYPLAFVPTATVLANYLFSESTRGGVSYSHGASTNLQIGTVASTDVVSVRGSYSFGRVLPRTFSASAGYLHSSPIGEASELIAGGTGSALSADVGLSWGLAENVVATLRYSVAYQFDQGEFIDPSLTHILLVGVTAHYANQRVVRRMPGIGGQRVDSADNADFPGGDKRR